MPKSDPTLAPQQARSRESLSRLLRAAIHVLAQQGLAGTTIPRIAARAGLTPGAVYRRFRNKDVLLETVILRILADQADYLSQSLPLASAAATPLPALAAQVIGIIVTSYRANADLLRAIRQLMQEKEGSPFWKRAAMLEMRTFEHLVELFTANGREIEHPKPRLAVSLGILMLIGTVWEVVVTPGDRKLWKDLLPPDDKALESELTRSFLRHLGIKP